MASASPAAMILSKLARSSATSPSCIVPTYLPSILCALQNAWNPLLHADQNETSTEP